MPRRALRQVMSVQDVYAYAEPIMQMLREEYGSYDADSLEEVQVEDPFVQRLQARGYEVRVPTDAPAAAIASDGAPATRTVGPRRRPATPTASPVAPTASPAVPAASSAAPAADAARPATRTRRTSTAATSGDEGTSPTRRSAGTTARTTTTRRTTRTAPTGDDNE